MRLYCVSFGHLLIARQFLDQDIGINLTILQQCCDFCCVREWSFWYCWLSPRLSLKIRILIPLLLSATMNFVWHLQSGGRVDESHTSTTPTALNKEWIEDWAYCFNKCFCLLGHDYDLKFFSLFPTIMIIILIIINWH